MQKKSNFNLLIFSLAGYLMSSSAFGAADVFRQVRQFKGSRTELGIQTSYFSAAYNYDPQGNTFTRLDSGRAYTLYETDIGARLSMWDRIGFFGSGRIAAAESKSPLNNRNNSAFTQMTFGADYLLSGGGMNWIPEVSVTLPVKKLDFLVDEVALGEGVSTFTGKMKGQIVGKSYYFDSGLGLTFRSNNRSTILPFNVGAHFNLGRSWSLGVDLNGYTTVFRENESDLARHTWACNYNGCARRFGAVNPTLAELTGALQIHTSPRFSLRLDAGSSITGTNIAGGTLVALGINYTFGLGSRAAIVPNTFEEEKMEQEFVPETNEEVDHSQFQTIEQSPSQQAPTAPPPLNRPRKNQDLLQNELDKTEMQIELRSTKKKK